MATTHRYFVYGHGQFPDDMLRYDQSKVVQDFVFEHRKGKILESQRLPTLGRWTSFLWSVSEMKMRYPGNDPENGPAEWHVKIGDTWEPIRPYPPRRPSEGSPVASV